tara:strand:+ start:1647 stop:2387 length:741 start_codon:yes stop_codon:yes gene_type:complete
MDDIENLVDPMENNVATVAADSNVLIKLQPDRIYTILRIVEDINNQAKLDLEITDAENNEIMIDEPTWMQPQRTGSSGTVIYDPVGTVSFNESGEFKFKNSNSTSTLYIVDDQSVDIQAFQQPGIFVAFISCCFGLLLLPLSLIIYMIQRGGQKEEKVVLAGMPTNRIPTTDELFLIREGQLDPREIKGVQRTQSVPPPFTNMPRQDGQQKQEIDKVSSITEKSSNKLKEADLNSSEDDWQTWDSG